ncbi:MAG: AAA family ATPase [Solirubrobacteraceae bacterium]
MRLRSVQITGYKRFAAKQTFYLGARVIAIVGPNEAGKTSLLKALLHLPAEAAFDRREFTGRRQPASRTTIVKARYEVEEADRADLTHLLDKEESYAFERYLDSDGMARWYFEPPIRRDTSAREALSKQIASLNENEALDINFAADEDGNTPDPDTSISSMAGALAEALSEASEDLDEDQLTQVDAFQQILEARGSECGDPSKASDLLEAVTDVAAKERIPRPSEQIYATLNSRVPQMLEFNDDQRALRSDYVWSEMSTAPNALGNLLHLADVDFDEYRSLASDRDRRDELSTFERKLNKTLKERLDAWSQHELTITLRADTESLAVHVTDEDTQRDVPIEERSAGLRMFAALLAFCARYASSTPPILLFDEAETHLHYGAQADLMDVFAKQDVAQAVIYTTHSIGCLPEDLGRSIRVVAPVGNEESEIRNEFWSGGVGLTPLMLAMGASAIAFSPARYAVLGEGPTESILLPSLFRAARSGTNGGRALGFQVASGTAEVAANVAPDLETEAGNVAYLFDADEGGREHAKKLAQRAHNEGRVFILGDGTEADLCTEDLVARETYVAAVNEILRDTRNSSDEFTVEEMPAVGRANYVNQWCEARGIAPLSKTRIAERALRIADKTDTLLEPSRKVLTAKLYRDLCKALGLK